MYDVKWSHVDPRGNSDFILFVDCKYGDPDIGEVETKIIKFTTT